MELRGIVTTTVLILAIITISTTTAAAVSCDCDICVNTTGWWNDGGAFNASTTPIQAAVNNASGGDTICVAAGSYTENVDIATAHLTLAGAGADVVTVTVANSDDHVLYVTADYVNISGFNATGATVSNKAGIYLGGADHCKISENNCPNNYYGIWLGSSSNNTLESNNASNNSIDGIALYSSSNNTLESNTVSYNEYGIYQESSSNNNTFESNNASNNYFGIGLNSLSNDNTLESNTASNNKYGIVLVSSSNNTLESNTASYNEYGIYLYDSSDNTLVSNNASNNTPWDICIRSSDSTFTDNTLNGTTISFTYSGDISLKGVGSPAADPTGQQTIGKFINATNQSTGAWLFLNFSYSEADVSGLDESNLMVWKHNGTVWLEDGWNGTRYLDTAGNVVGVNITSFSVFAPAAPDPTNLANTTGGGWFYPDDEGTLPDGKANFGFTARYKNDVSTGKLNFQYNDAGIHFKSTSIDWLTISSVSAQFQGTGTINGDGLYTFRVKAKDNGEPGVDVDHFDIKIWNGTDTEADPYHKAKNTIAGGNIQVHKK